jgi:hypothetical protein
VTEGGEERNSKGQRSGGKKGKQKTKIIFFFPSFLIFFFPSFLPSKFKRTSQFKLD